ncbi:MAG TPA: MerR family transcriptional regulator [Methylophilaceae bacterium]|nr:MerR family transcriptional regulator [Methylophilaceae bacterium]
MSLMTRSSNDAFPIRTVAALTGINPVTLRTWERRYHLIEPTRTPKGHRLYSKDQIAMLNRVVALIEGGVSISQINLSQIAGDATSRITQEEEFWGRLIERMVVAISHFNESTLESTYNEALSLYPIETVTQKLLMPMLGKLGMRWESGEGTIAEEHFFGVYLRNKLGARFHHRKRNDHAPGVITACMPGERHEAGLLLFALSAYDHGYRSILLGADMPLEELPAAVKQSQSKAIVLSASFMADADLIKQDLTKLVSQVKVPVFIGGHTSVMCGDSIKQAGAIPLGVDIDYSFKLIAETLKKQFASSLNLV